MFRGKTFNRHDQAASSRYVAGVVIIAVIALLFIMGVRDAGIFGAEPVNKKTYQLVSLVTGEVYFGKLSNINQEYVTLNQVYTQDNSVVAGQPSQEDSPPASEVVLNRVSASVAKPEDTMYIARDKIVHWENLQWDSKVVKAIQNDNK